MIQLNVDDWQFQAPGEPGSVLAADLYLNNGQQARMEVCPLFSHDSSGDQIPEIFVYCELPGERLNGQAEVKRWITRPPDKSCAWSRIELSPAFIRQINEMLALTVAPHAGAEAHS